MRNSENHPINRCEQQVEIKPRLSIEFPQPISRALYRQNYFVFQCNTYIMVYNLYSKEKIYFKVCTNNFFILPFPPYIFACIIGQIIYFYSEEALLDTKFISKAKISKMNVKAICSFNKGYFMGGYNRTPFPGGKLIDKRTIYYIEKISTNEKNKPLWEISIPKSVNPITFLETQNPFLICYCEPSLYVINPFEKAIILSFKKEMSFCHLLQGRYAINCLNIIGSSRKTHTIFTADMEKYPIYGVEVNQSQQKISSICQSKDGQIFCAWKNIIFNYDPFKKEKKTFKTYDQNFNIIELFFTPSNALVVLVMKKEECQVEEKEHSLECMEPCCREENLEKEERENEEESMTEITHHRSRMSLVRHKQMRMVQVFNMSE